MLECLWHYLTLQSVSGPEADQQLNAQVPRNALSSTGDYYSSDDEAEVRHLTACLISQ